MFDKAKYMKEWWKTHPAYKYQITYRRKYPDKYRESVLKRKYGISLKQYYDRLELQQNKCAICNKEFDKGQHQRPYVDHDHSTKVFRGLLCISCNSKLGWYEKLKEEIVNYLNGGNYVGI